ncbi:hypothetical protein EYF80_026625 [Liparis tanakae]|uniref:Uncharacterized protein n=1 Tax=Liparis tanakae TaxID=230148 RepID=A0A4Z2HC07_9TELE|nr:hypothetical protein EYF80_026625 [Liparis tanakae]
MESQGPCLGRAEVGGGGGTELVVRQVHSTRTAGSVQCALAPLDMLERHLCATAIQFTLGARGQSYLPYERNSSCALRLGMAVVTACVGIEADQGPIARDLSGSSRGTERVGA